MRIKQIDGLRFWACMVILADHCRVLGLRYQGGIMVSLFFVLSGFFIAKPLKQDGEEQFPVFKGMGKFLSHAHRPHRSHALVCPHSCICAL